MALAPSLALTSCGDGDDDSESGGDTGGAPSNGGEGSGGVGSGGLPTSGGGPTSGGETGSGGSPNVDAPVPSTGCTAASNGRPANGIDYEPGDSWLIFPESYDGTMPYPVLFGWHGCGSYNFGDGARTEWLDATRNSGFEDDYIVAAPLAASGSCYEYDTDIERSKAVYDKLIENYCVDTSRVFGTGHSSGAGFVVEILANADDFAHFNFRGIAPVSAWVVGGDWAQVPVMYIQGITDSERGGGDGRDVVDKFASTNDCGMTSTTYEPVAACNSSDGGGAVNDGCISFEECAKTTVWCSHDDPNYSGTFHGIPCFFGQAAYDFFENL